MSKFSKSQELINNSKTAPTYPTECQTTGCENETEVAFMRVFNKNTARKEIGAFSGHSGYGKRDGKGTGKPSYGYMSNNDILMNDQFDFIGWVTRCGVCYRRDLNAQGKSAIQVCKEQAIHMLNKG